MPDAPPPPPPRPEGCEHCEKPCGVYLTQVNAAGAHSLGMCADCPQAKTLLDPARYTPAAPQAEVRCPACGFTPADFARENRFGCPRCYDTFGDLVRRVLAIAQPALTHAGKHPAQHHGALTRSRWEAARAELKQAVAREDFEAAARLRDEIRALEAALPAPDAPPPPAAGAQER